MKHFTLLIVVAFARMLAAEPCDVMVVGGGPAGIAAALQAGRSGASVMKLDDPCDCQDVRNVAVDLKPGKNEIKVRVRAGSDGRWYLSLGLLRSDRQQTPIGMVGKGESISFRR